MLGSRSYLLIETFKTIFKSSILSFVLGIAPLIVSGAEEVKIAGAMKQNDFFQLTADVSKDSIIIGSHNTDDGKLDSGSAKIFVRRGHNAWIEQAKITAKDPEFRGGFGWSVAISGNTAIVGAPNRSANNGGIYIFERTHDNWKQPKEQIITAKDSAEGDNFGMSVSIDGKFAIIGAPGNDDGGNNAGSAYIFKRDADGWKEQTKLIGKDVEAGNGFGNSVFKRCKRCKIALIGVTTIVCIRQSSQNINIK